MATNAASLKPARGLFARVYRDLLADRARLPVMPDIALRLGQLTRGEDYALDDAVRLLQADAAIAAYLVNIANSPLYRTRSPARHLKAATNRLGLPAVRNLVTGYTLRTAFRSRSPLLRNALKRCWRDSARIAAIAAALARRCPGFEPDQALLAGLLQDIGSLLLIAGLEGHAGELTENALDAGVAQFAAPAGAALLFHWNFDAGLVEVVRAREDWMRDPGPSADLADLVNLARLHALVGSPRMHALPRINALPAYAKLPLGTLTPRHSLEILELAEGEIAALAALLAG